MRQARIPVTVKAVARASIETTFDAIVPIALPEMFTGFGPLPAVTATREQTGEWDHAGATRTVVLADGSPAREEITSHERPHYFANRVSGFTARFRLLVRGARGEWWFSPASGEGTRVRWRYTFEPRGAARPIVALAVARLWVAMPERRSSWPCSTAVSD